jgi:hypothetical protein
MPSSPYKFLYQKNSFLFTWSKFFHFSAAFFIFSFSVLRFEFRAYTLSHSTRPFFVMGFFEIRSGKLLAWAGFKPQSS